VSTRAENVVWRPAGIATAAINNASIARTASSDSPGRCVRTAFSQTWARTIELDGRSLVRSATGDAR
jgi:hypothetical protein